MYKAIAAVVGTAVVCALYAVACAHKKQQARQRHQEDVSRWEDDTGNPAHDPAR